MENICIGLPRTSDEKRNRLSLNSMRDIVVALKRLSKSKENSLYSIKKMVKETNGNYCVASGDGVVTVVFVFLQQNSLPCLTGG